MEEICPVVQLVVGSLVSSDFVFSRSVFISHYSFHLIFFHHCPTKLPSCLSSAALDMSQNLVVLSSV